MHFLVHVKSNWGERESVCTMTSMIKCPESPIHGCVKENVKLSRDVPPPLKKKTYIRYLDKLEYCFSVADSSHTFLFPILPLLASPYSWLTSQS